MAKNKTTLENLHSYNIDEGKRILYLFGEITQEKACEFLKNAAYLTEESSAAGFDVILNSPGGEINASMAICDCILNSGDVRVIVYGEAMSMAVAIVQSASLRVASKYSRWMVHQGTTEISETNTSNLKAETIETLQTSNIYEKMLFDRMREKDPKFRIKKLRDMLNKTTYFNAQEALFLGLIDEVI